MRAMNDMLTEFYDLANAQCEGELTAAQGARLEELVVGNADLRRRYIVYMQMNAGIEMDASLTKCNVQYSPPTRVFQPTPLPLGFLGNAYHGMVGFFSQEVPFSILIATLVFGLAGLIGSMMTVDHHTQLAGRSTTATDRPFVSNKEAAKSPVPEKMEYVGRITSMVDCVWSDDKGFLPPSGNYVALGREYKLDAGLMEITYNTGARVILQGPCMFTAESAAGGYLSLGKLTARVESRSRLPDGTSRSRLPSGTLPTDRDASKSRPAGGTYFAVRTPTATVTDLGTEFGVEVKKSGEASVLVIVGEVEMASAGGSDGVDHRLRLKKGQAAHVEKIGNKPALVNATGKAGSFVRAMADYCPPNFDPKATRVLITTADVKPTWWRVTEGRPLGDWTAIDFDDSQWGGDDAGFGVSDFVTPEATVRTPWMSSDIWLRKKIVHYGPVEFETAELTIRHDDDAEVYVNGKLIFAEAGYNLRPTAHDVTAKLKAAMKSGVNLVAVHAQQKKPTGQYIDLGLALNPKAAGHVGKKQAVP